MASRVGPRERVCADGHLGHPLDRVRVRVWHGNYSAFNGYRFAPSDYSAVVCVACGTPWRTNAAYVEDLLSERR